MERSPLIQKAASKTTVDYCRLSLVRNPDGFLARTEVGNYLNEWCGLTVVKGTPMDLRIHYELIFKQTVTEKFIYLCENLEDIVPDMKADAYMVDFKVADLFPLFADKSLLSDLDTTELSMLYERTAFRRVAMSDCSKVVTDVKTAIAHQRKQSAEHFQELLSYVSVDWTDHTQETITQLSEVMTDAVKCNVYDELDKQFQNINRDFQSWIDQYYFAQLNSNYLLRPKSVNQVLPYLAEKHQADDQVALIVIDGFAYWQYGILRGLLHEEGIKTTDNHILAWIPTITMLSRQAIFRGDTPKQDYKQNPQNEQKLWTDFWTAHGVARHVIQYISDKDEFAINEGIKRLAYVTVEMDEKMHSSTDYKDLLALTQNWSARIIIKIKTLRGLGYTVYLTTDHGSVLSEGWQVISAVEKVFLYKDGSRGKRHLIYNDVEQKNNFLNKHGGEINLLSRDNWLAVRSNQCFEREGQQVITHGGSHFWEVVIPFVTIE